MTTTSGQRVKSDIQLSNHVTKHDNFISFRIKRENGKIVSRDYEFNLLKRRLPSINIRNQNLDRTFIMQRRVSKVQYLMPTKQQQQGANNKNSILILIRFQPIKNKSEQDPLVPKLPPEITGAKIDTFVLDKQMQDTGFEKNIAVDDLMIFTNLKENERESHWRVHIFKSSPPVQFYPLANFDNAFRALKISHQVLTSLNVFEDGIKKENLKRFDVNSLEGTEIPAIMNLTRSSPMASSPGSVASSSSPASNRFGSPKSSPQRSPAGKPKTKAPIRNPKRNRELLSLPRQSDAPKEKERKVAVTDAIQNLIDLNQTSQNEQPASKTAEAANATSSSTSDQIEASTSKIPPETVHVEQPDRDHPPLPEPDRDHPPPPGEEEQQQPQDKTSHEVMPDKENPKTTNLLDTPSMKGLSDISDDTLPPCDQLKGRLSDLSDETVPDDSNNTQLKGVSTALITLTSGLSDISDGDLPPDDDSNVIITSRRISALSDMSDGNRALCEMVIGMEDEQHEEGELLDETLVPDETSRDDSAKTKEATTDDDDAIDHEIPAEQSTNSLATPNDDSTRSEQPMVTDINLEEVTKIKSKLSF